MKRPITKLTKTFIIAVASLAVSTTSLGVQVRDSLLNDPRAKLILAQKEAAQARGETAQAKAETAQAKGEAAQVKGEAAQFKAETAQANIPGSDIQNSSIFDMFSDLFYYFQDFLSSLNMVQTLGVVNLIVLIFIIVSLFNIFILYLSDFYIKVLNLETRYPKLAFFFKAKKSLTKGSLYGYTIILVLVLLHGLIVNSVIIILFL